MISVKLFATLKDKAGAGELRIQGDFATASDVIARVSRDCPALADMLSCGRILISVNREFVKQDSPVKDGDEVALMPPFSGGSNPAGRVRIQHGPFSLDQEIALLKTSSDTTGAIVAFLGTTRDLSGGRKVARLEFEHYPGMADKKLSEIRDRAIREFGVIDITIVHRIGTLPVGENIVLIAVASAHRDEAFRACRFCIDELKRITPIWKKETTEEGEIWVEEHP